jgi:hypothetical protein
MVLIFSIAGTIVNVPSTADMMKLGCPYIPPVPCSASGPPYHAFDAPLGQSRRFADCDAVMPFSVTEVIELLVQHHPRIGAFRDGIDKARRRTERSYRSTEWGW